MVSKSSKQLGERGCGGGSTDIAAMAHDGPEVANSEGLAGTETLFQSEGKTDQKWPAIQPALRLGVTVRIALGFTSSGSSHLDRPHRDGSTCRKWLLRTAMEAIVMLINKYTNTRARQPRCRQP